jgi:DMSO/TMAO reductase YedYZ molybdopterin-dependent catalytic subunit
MKRLTIAILAGVTALALLSAGCGPAATPASTSATASQSSAAVLSITGAVEKPASWTLVELKGMGMVKLDLNHPKNGMGSYEGIRLTILLNAAKPTSGAKTLTMSASDGYVSDVALADVMKCSDCLLAIDSAGALSAAMPNMASGTWVRNLVKLDVK